MNLTSPKTTQSQRYSTLYNKLFTQFSTLSNLSRRARLTVIYGLLLVVLYLASFALPMDDKGWYVNLVILLNLTGIAAFYLQFPLAGRLKNTPLFKNIDWAIAKHKTIGYWIGGIFFLHPLLIIAPKLQLSTADGWRSVLTVIMASEMLTGLIAWVLFVVWVLMSIFKNKLPMRYETWRFIHSLGFVIIAFLATVHVTSVGSHGQFEDAFNVVFWVLCTFAIAGVIYDFAFKPSAIKNTAFTVQSVKKVSSSDWMLTLNTDSNTAKEFSFDAGQFVWINSHHSAYDLDTHPFSIASCRSDLPNMSFIIRELGDYTHQLGSLEVGQMVYVDGPFGQMTLDESRKARGITLIAGGAGLAPMLSLLRQLVASGDTRPIRLVYGNKQWQQMVLLDELRTFQTILMDFKLILVCEEVIHSTEIYQGVIDKTVLTQVLVTDNRLILDEWAVYLCGPQAMMDSVQANLNKLGMSSAHIHYEKFVF